MSHLIETSVDIAAPAERVWALLLDADQFATWNPFLIKMTPVRAVGQRLDVTIHPPGGSAMSFRPTLLALTYPELRWRGVLLVRGLFDGEHYFRVEATGPDRTRFVHGERFTGVLVPVLKSMLGRTRAGFEAMNQALKVRAEKERRTF